MRHKKKLTCPRCQAKISSVVLERRNYYTNWYIEKSSVILSMAEVVKEAGNCTEEILENRWREQRQYEEEGETNLDDTEYSVLCPSCGQVLMFEDSGLEGVRDELVTKKKKEEEKEEEDDQQGDVIDKSIADPRMNYIATQRKIHNIRINKQLFGPNKAELTPYECPHCQTAFLSDEEENQVCTACNKKFITNQ
jgi:DNA-directed RNA polymerase subunit RPC12/RpoP